MPCSLSRSESASQLINLPELSELVIKQGERMKKEKKKKRKVRNYVTNHFFTVHFIISRYPKACLFNISPLSHGGHIVPGDQKSFVLPR